MGMPMLGGPVTTAGNVFFIGATADNYLRAFSVTNGEKLWKRACRPAVSDADDL